MPRKPKPVERPLPKSITERPLSNSITQRRLRHRPNKPKRTPVEPPLDHTQTTHNSPLMSHDDLMDLLLNELMPPLGLDAIIPVCRAARTHKVGSPFAEFCMALGSYLQPTHVILLGVRLLCRNVPSPNVQEFVNLVAPIVRAKYGTVWNFSMT